MSPEETVEKAERILERLQVEWNAGYANWALFEAGNGQTASDREHLHASVRGLRLAKGFKTILNSLAAQALLAVARITDQPGRDTHCFGALNGLIGDPAQRAHLVLQAEGWFAHRSVDRDKPFRGSENRELVEQRLPAAIDRMNRFRRGLGNDAIRRTRTQQLAHALPLEGEHAKFDEIKDALIEAGEVLKELSLVVRGYDLDLTQMKNSHEKAAAHWWDSCDRAFELLGDEALNSFRH